MDWDDIMQSGEFIVVTLNGEDTYFEQGGIMMGAVYAVVSEFAKENGLRLRIETAQDTLDAIKMLQESEADVVALPLSRSLVNKEHLMASGIRDSINHTTWAVRSSSEKLAENLNQWIRNTDIQALIRQEGEMRSPERRVKRRVRAPFLSREKGEISIYDDAFKHMAGVTRTDWRLIAAQCYQESGFDPEAVSYAGAKGLMQLMPATAEAMGTPSSELFDPHVNLETATRYLCHLQGLFHDIPRSEERTKFVLAAYNGGPGHIRDAMSLAKKHGNNPHLWAEVEPFIRRLSQPAYYRDPVVKHGYMIGNETADYVSSILARYRAYGGTVSNMSSTSSALPRRSCKNKGNNRKNKIYTPEELKNK